LSGKGYCANAPTSLHLEVLSRICACQNNRARPARSGAANLVGYGHVKKLEANDIMSVAIAPKVANRVLAIVQDLLERRAIERSIRPDEDLRDAGLNSLDMVNLMLSVEAEFGLEIPDAAMTLQNFRSISTIDAFVSALLQR
jgi:acyl carrier protein